jgi:hypothetical protein
VLRVWFGVLVLLFFWAVPIFLCYSFFGWLQGFVWRGWCLGFGVYVLLFFWAVPRILCYCFWLAARLCLKRLVLRVWCLGFALLLGLCQGF